MQIVKITPFFPFIRRIADWGWRPGEVFYCSLYSVEPNQPPDGEFKPEEPSDSFWIIPGTLTEIRIDPSYEELMTAFDRQKAT